MLELSIDRENKKLHAVVELFGEENPITVDAQYEISLDVNMQGAIFIANEISISREWIDRLAQEFVGQEFRVEGKNTARLIKLVKEVGLV